MAIRAWLENNTAEGLPHREARRRVLLEGFGTRDTGDVLSITVHNISASGMLLECGDVLEAGALLRVDLPDAPETEAVIVWVSGLLHGCKFTQPLGRSTLSAALLRSAVTDDVVAPQTAKKPTLDEPLGNRLRRLRKARGLTLADLANELGVSKPTVWAWEQGRSMPTQDRHKRIAEVLETTVSDLRSGRDGDAATVVLERSRQQIAEAYNVDAEQVRIMIEL